MFIAAVENADKLKISNFNTRDTRDAEVEYLSTWFSKKQLDLVEQYYERHTSEFRSAPEPDWRRHPIFNEHESDKRMKMIMENIISNRGTFNPKRGKHSIKGS